MAKSVSSGTSAGLGAGVLTSSAVPLLVGQLASASTGTAIGSLSGAAATNATLAWLGGGSIASGGGGMAAGSIVLGGLTFGIGLISAAAITSVVSHVSANKEIKKIKEKEIEALKIIDDIKKNLLSFDLIEKRCNEIGLSIEKTQEVFTIELKKTYKKIYPYKFISKIFKQTKKIFQKNYFSKNNVKQIAHLGEIGRDLAKLLETNVIEIK